MFFLISSTGHINHSLFWTNLAPSGSGGGELEDGPLKHAIESRFGEVDEFKKTFNAKAATIQGSGWAWLVRAMHVSSAITLKTAFQLGAKPCIARTGDCDHREPGSLDLYARSFHHTLMGY